MGRSAWSWVAAKPMVRHCVLILMTFLSFLMPLHGKTKEEREFQNQQQAWGCGMGVRAKASQPCGQQAIYPHTFSSLPPPISAVGKGGRQDRKYLHCKPDRTEGHQLLYFSQPTLVHKQPTHQAGISLPTLLGPNKPGQSLGWDLGPGSHLPTAPIFCVFPPHPRPRVKASARSVPRGPSSGTS